MQGKKKKLRLDIFKGSEFKGHYLKQSLQKRCEEEDGPELKGRGQVAP